jgi:hypothetical protein
MVFETGDYMPWAIDNIMISLMYMSNDFNMTRADGRLYPLSLRITGEWLPDKNFICG